jgi:3'(2'), 5'-bisphosphate nucleotidase
MSEFISDDALAEYLASHAGKLLLELQRAGPADTKTLGKAGDRIANRFLMDALHTHRPDDAILSEEEADSSARLAVKRVWIIDPLDGTREYGEARSDWAVHVALAIDGIATIGAVALPGLGLTFTSGKPVTLLPSHSPLKMLVSRTRPAAEAIAVAKALGAELLPMGSAGAKAMAILRGEADIYLHSGGQYEWDNCAPVAVAQAAGLHCSRINGAPLVYNISNPYLPDLLICKKEIATQILSLISSAIVA